MRGAGGGPPRHPRVPIQPLIAALINRGHIEPDHTGADIARAIGIEAGTTRQAINEGELTVYQADRAAWHGLGEHPTTIWGDTWLDHNWMRAGRIEACFEALRVAS